MKGLPRSKAIASQPRADVAACYLTIAEMATEV